MNSSSSSSSSSSSCFVLWLLCCTCGTLEMSVCLHVRAHAHYLPLTTPPSASVAAPSPPPRAIVGIDARRTLCRGCAVCCEGRPCRKGRGRTDRYRRQSIASTRVGVLGAPCIAHALVTRTPPQTHHTPQIALAWRGKGRSAAPGGRGHCARVHHLPSRDHRRSTRELRCPTSIALCSDDVLLH